MTAATTRITPPHGSHSGGGALGGNGGNGGKLTLGPAEAGASGPVLRTQVAESGRLFF